MASVMLHLAVLYDKTGKYGILAFWIEYLVILHIWGGHLAHCEYASAWKFIHPHYIIITDWEFPPTLLAGHARAYVDYTRSSSYQWHLIILWSDCVQDYHHCTSVHPSTTDPWEVCCVFQLMQLYGDVIIATLFIHYWNNCTVFTCCCLYLL